MHHWDRNTVGLLERVSAPVEQGCEVSLNCEQMEPPPEEQQSQQGVQRDPNAYRSMRDHIHLPRVKVWACALGRCTYCFLPHQLSRFKENKEK